MLSPTKTPRRVRTGSKFELYMWFFTRVSGVLLLMMGAYSLVYANLAGGYGQMDAAGQMRWAFFPISFHVQSTQVEVTPNFLNAFWQGYAFLLIVFAATHAANGLRVVCQDYIRRPMLLAWVKAFLVLLWGAVLLAAAFLLFVFQG
jgi:succinate dehydrogenase / fumarate reductase membrane anchor subunit